MTAPLALTCRRCKLPRPADAFVARQKTALSGICSWCRSPQDTAADLAEREAGWCAGSGDLAQALRAWWAPPDTGQVMVVLAAAFIEMRAEQMASDCIQKARQT